MTQYTGYITLKFVVTLLAPLAPLPARPRHLLFYVYITSTAIETLCSQSTGLSYIENLQNNFSQTLLTLNRNSVIYGITFN